VEKVDGKDEIDIFVVVCIKLFINSCGIFKFPLNNAKKRISSPKCHTFFAIISQFGAKSKKSLHIPKIVPFSFYLA